jgi:hypothetical protein
VVRASLLWSSLASAAQEPRHSSSMDGVTSLTNSTSTRAAHFRILRVVDLYASADDLPGVFIPVSHWSRASLSGFSSLSDAGCLAASSSAIFSNCILTGSRKSRSAWATFSACAHERVFADLYVTLPFS